MTFLPKLGVVIASAEGTSEKIEEFYRGTRCDVIIFKFHVVAVALPPADAHVRLWHCDVTRIWRHMQTFTSMYTDT